MAAAEDGATDCAAAEEGTGCTIDSTAEGTTAVLSTDVVVSERMDDIVVRLFLIDI